jgi:ferrochelatase
MTAFLDRARLGAQRTDLVVLNFGGPTQASEVEPFLYELFDDPDVIQLPLSGLLQDRFARLISSRRAPGVVPHYEHIGFSPIIPTTLLQVEALRTALGGRGLTPKIHVVMRYTAPRAAQVARQIAADPPGRLVALALYPHYSGSTTGSSFNELSGALGQVGLGRLPVRYIPAFYDHPRFLAAVASLVREAIAQVRDPARAHIIFSAHGLPSSYFLDGDPYPTQVQDTVRLLMRQLEWPGTYSLAYQSKVGPVRWLTPSTDNEIRRLATAGTRELVVVPVAFVSDHIETLYEIDVEFREVAEKLGAHLYRTKPLDVHPDFIECLSDVVAQAFADDTYRGLGAHSCVRCLLPKPHEHRMRAQCMDCGHQTPKYLLRLPPVRE